MQHVGGTTVGASAATGRIIFLIGCRGPPLPRLRLEGEGPMLLSLCDPSLKEEPVSHTPLASFSSLLEESLSNMHHDAGV